jgi:ribosomal protein S18 acetylase RimI-like enzyme
MLSVRRAVTNDIPLIRELTFQIWPQTYAPILSTAQIAYMLDMMYSETALNKQFNDGHSFIICYIKEEPVGFASWSEISAGIYKLHKIYVLPQKQRSGIGKYLIQYIVSNIKERQAIALELNVNRYNTAKIFYEKLGFVVIREEDIDIGGGYFMNDYVLRCDLN